ncbi:hypothetical protein ACFL2H_02035 [Planctomycetota bacterium]
MWCSSCREDVLPVSSSQDELARECMRCGTVIQIHGPSSSGLSPLGPAGLWTQPVEQRGMLAGMPLQFNGGTRILRQDAPHHGELRSEKRRKLKNRNRGSFLIWFALMMGLAAMTCGVVLAAWSVVVQRDDFWRIGIPVAAGGLTFFLVGMALQLDSIYVQPRTSFRNSAATDLGRSHESQSGTRTGSLTPSQAHEPARMMHDLTSRLQGFAAKIPQEF